MTTTRASTHPSSATTRDGAVAVRFTAPEHRARVASGGTVHLVGDFPDFRVPHAMLPDDDGVPSVTLSLPPGVYRMKFIVDQTEWTLPRVLPALTDATVPDATHPAHTAPLTESIDGFTNAVVVIGGQGPPLLFADDARHRRRDDDGALVVRAEGIRAPSHVHPEKSAAAARVTVTLDDDTRATAPLSVVGARGDRVLYSGRVPLSRAATGSFTLTLDEGRREATDDTPGAQRFALPAWREDPYPTWAKDAVFMFVLVDRWHRWRTSAPDKRARPRTHPSYPTVFYGGDLSGVREALPYFTELGIDALVLSPVHPSPTPHRYDSTDLMRTDDTLGGERALRALIDDAHGAGLRVVVDLAVTHVNHQHPFFRSVLAFQERSPYTDFFRVKQFPVRRRDPQTYAHYWDCVDLPWLALENAAPAAHALDVARRYAALGVDGLRLDAMLDAPAEFWRTLTRTLHQEFPALLLLGEVVGDHFTPFLAGDDDTGVHMATDGRYRESMIRALTAASPTTNAPSALETLADDLIVHRHRTGVFKDHARTLFLDTHDTGRFLSRVHDDDTLALALVFTAFMPHPWLLTYGTECGLAARTDEPPLDGAWPERKAMPPLDDARTHPLFAITRDATALRRALRDAHGGALTVAVRETHRLVLTRDGDDALFTLTLTDNAMQYPAAFDVLRRIETRAFTLTVERQPRAPLPRAPKR
jgi:cyclomaltodextrinase